MAVGSEPQLLETQAEATQEPNGLELARNNRWLIRLRWLAALGIIAATLVAARLLSYPVPVTSLLALGVAVAAYNAAFTLVERLLTSHQHFGNSAAVALANTQIVLDLVALAALMHLAGGVTNPFAIYFVFHMIIASILLTPVAAYAQATLASVLFALVVFGERLGVLPHTPVFAERAPQYTLLDDTGHVVVLGSTLFITVFLTSAITQKLRQRDLHLAAAVQDLQRTQEMRLRYMRRVSHELRSPLASLAMTLRVVHDALGAGVSNDHRELVLRAEARAETLLDMVDDLLTLSRMREAPLQEAITDVNLAALIANVVVDLGDDAAQKGLALSVDVPPGLPTIPGQAEALRTMLLNLVGNAIKYTPGGGAVRVSAAAAADGRSLTIAVRDDGEGIAPEDCARLFEEFFRTEGARQSGIHGTGLGLTICKLTAEAHQGDISVESALGQGTTFTVRLPVAQPRRDPAASVERPGRRRED